MQQMRIDFHDIFLPPVAPHFIVPDISTGKQLLNTYLLEEKDEHLKVCIQSGLKILESLEKWKDDIGNNPENLAQKIEEFSVLRNMFYRQFSIKLEEYVSEDEKDFEILHRSDLGINNDFFEYVSKKSADEDTPYIASLNGTWVSVYPGDTPKIVEEKFWKKVKILSAIGMPFDIEFTRKEKYQAFEYLFQLVSLDDISDIQVSQLIKVIEKIADTGTTSKLKQDTRQMIHQVLKFLGFESENIKSEHKQIVLFYEILNLFLEVIDGKKEKKNEFLKKIEIFKSQGYGNISLSTLATIERIKLKIDFVQK